MSLFREPLLLKRESVEDVLGPPIFGKLAARNRSNSNVANFNRSFMRVVFHEMQSPNDLRSAAIVELQRHL